MIQGKWFPQGTDLAEPLSVRRAVFGRGEDSLDAESQNVIVYEDGVPAAAGRLWWKDGSFWLGDLGVLSEKRGRRLGDLVLRLLLFKAQSHFAREIRLRCPESVSGFFARLGFQEAHRGEEDVEMVLPGDRIQLDACKSCRKAGCPNRSAPAEI